MIINELSIHCEEQKKVEVDAAVREFIAVCHELSAKQGAMDFYYSAKLLQEELLPQYTLYDWLQKGNASKAEKTYLRTLINRRQLIEEEQYLGSQVFVTVDGEKKEALGCLVAYESDEVVVSMRTNPLWENDRIDGEYFSLSETDDGIRNENVTIKNCSEKRHVDMLRQEERQEMFSRVSSGRELWEKRESLYPHLIFCDSVEKQLEKAGNSLQIRTIIKRLKILEDYFAKYDGNFNKDDVGYGCREESESVENNKETKGMRTFKTPYGKEEFFSWHISFAGDYPGRIHFLPDAEHKVGVIGYIGKHLPTSKYTTI